MTTGEIHRAQPPVSIAPTYPPATSLDYADQRYYSNQFGRFMSPDPYKASTRGSSPKNPQSWNRYAYVTGDPINYVDTKGLFQEIPQFLYSPTGIIFGAIPQIDFDQSMAALMQSMIQGAADNLNRTLSGGIAAMLTSNDARPLLDQKLNALQNDSSNDCLSQLESLTGKSFDQIKTAADSITYYDMSTAAAELTLSDIGLTGSQNLTTYFYSQPGGRLRRRFLGHSSCFWARGTSLRRFCLAIALYRY